MAAIKMQPLVIDMGGANQRKFASNADFDKVAQARLIKITNSNGGVRDGVYSAVASLNNVIPSAGDDAFGIRYFIGWQGNGADGAFEEAQVALIYKLQEGGQEVPYIQVYEY